MPNPNQQTGVPIEHYQQEFAAADPKELSLKSGVAFDGQKFTVNLLNRRVYVYWPDMKTIYADDEKEAAAYTKILCARIILYGCFSAAFGEFKAYTDMPWGNVYSQQFRGRCIMRLAGSYGHNIEGFKKSCEAVGGRAVKFGDACYDIDFISSDRGNYTVRLTMWEGDDEFPSTAQVLFSDNFPTVFTAEDIAVVGDILINALKGRW